MDASRRWTLGLLLFGAALLWAAGATATPLGLLNGDVIDTIEWDAFRANGDGGSYTWDGSTGRVTTDGQITSLDVQRAPAYPPTLTTINTGGLNVDIVFNADLVSYFQVGSFANITFGTSAVDPDFEVYQNGNLVLFGDFMGNFVFAGDILSTPTLISAGNISITGGDPTLVAAIGNIATLTLRATVGNFIPGLAALGGDGNIVNSNFTMEFSGTLRPANASPFVPEPGTAVLGGLGALGLLAFARRSRS
jgi:hypothetical protein